MKPPGEEAGQSFAVTEKSGSFMKPPAAPSADFAAEAEFGPTPFDGKRRRITARHRQKRNTRIRGAVQQTKAVEIARLRSRKNFKIEQSFFQKKLAFLTEFMYTKKACLRR